MWWKTTISASISAATMLAPCYVDSQPGGLLPTSGPGGGPISQLVMTTDGDLFAFAGDLHRSADEGWSWHIVSAAPGTSRLAAGLASDVWAWPWSGSALYRTTDDGATWTPLASAPAGIRTLSFAAADHVFAATASGLFISTDAGVTWAQATDVPAVDVRAVVSSPTGTGAAADRAIYHTEDGGGTWTRVAELSSRITALALHPQGGYYAGIEPDTIPPYGGIWRVNLDGTAVSIGLGSHYIEHLLARSDGVVFAGSAGVFDGYNPHGMGLYRSADGNPPWGGVGCAGSVGGLACDAGDEVFAAMREYFTDVGDLPACGVITTNGPGTQWEKRNRGLGGATIFDLATSEAGVLYAAADWTIAWTDDDGVSWNEVETALPEVYWPDEGGMWRLAVHLDGMLFAAHSTEPLYRSADRGRSWTVSGSFNGVQGITITARGSVLAAVGGDIWRSTDRGESWTRVRTGNGFESTLTLVSGPLDRVAASTYTEILLGENDGTSWGPVLASTGRPAFAPDEESLYVANGSQVQRWVETTGGWVPESMPAFPAAEEVAVDGDGRVYVANRISAAWMFPGDPSWNSLGGVTCFGWYIGQRTRLVIGSDGYLYFGTACDGVYRSATPSRSPTAVEDPGCSILTTWGCAPNPARGASTLTFRLERSSPVQVSVFDVRGRIVAMLANDQHFAPGSHAVPWIPAQDTPSGVYTYRVRAGDVVRGGRIVLVR